MAGILATKKLARNQKELLLNAGHSLVEQNFIAIVPLDFKLKKSPKNAIFTSKNAVKLVLKKMPGFQAENIFCVGDKTAAFLEEKGFAIKETANYGQELAEKIVTNYNVEDFTFFCGKKRRHELPDYLRKQNVSFSEVQVYDTELIQKRIDRTFDGVLFFSPSAVRSFCAVNDLSGSVAFCVGKTTASEAQHFTSQVKIAKKPSIENVIVQVVKHFGKN
ncbi:uroporphyrinogen-III synthase [Salinimicrobium sp. GXAS 041]|uniref:uroporphyrinogen-III synthase n=1 Tax=Salinimicrobium sp. GXAS 041 TaxID=3400806 RepID=UPI003C742130